MDFLLSFEDMADRCNGFAKSGKSRNCGPANTFGEISGEGTKSEALTHQKGNPSTITLRPVTSTQIVANQKCQKHERNFFGHENSVGHREGEVLKKSLDGKDLKIRGNC